MDSTAVQALHDAIQNAATMQERQDRIIDLVDKVDDEVRGNAAAIATVQSTIDALTTRIAALEAKATTMTLTDSVLNITQP